MIENINNNPETSTPENGDFSLENNREQIGPNKETTEQTTETEQAGKIENKPVRGVLFKSGQSGNPKGRPKNKPFSLKEDLLKSLKELKSKDKKKYWDIITSYWSDPKMRAFLMEQIDGKATQSMNIGSLKDNPVRIIEVSPPNEL